METARSEGLSARNQIQATRLRCSRMRGDRRGRPWEHPEYFELRRERRKARVPRSTLDGREVVEVAKSMKRSSNGEHILAVPIRSAVQKVFVKLNGGSIRSGILPTG